MNASVERVIYVGLNRRFAGKAGIVYFDRKQNCLCFVPMTQKILALPFTAEDLTAMNDEVKLRIPRGENIEPYLQ